MIYGEEKRVRYKNQIETELAPVKNVFAEFYMHCEIEVVISVVKI